MLCQGFARILGEGFGGHLRIRLQLYPVSIIRLFETHKAINKAICCFINNKAHLSVFFLFYLKKSSIVKKKHFIKYNKLTLYLILILTLLKF